jgi:hypothetical protein
MQCQDSLHLNEILIGKLMDKRSNANGNTKHKSTEWCENRYANQLWFEQRIMY